MTHMFLVCSVMLTGRTVGLTAGEGPMRTLTILCTNDFHGQYMPIYVFPGNATAQSGDPGASRMQVFPRAGEIGGFAYLLTRTREIRTGQGRGNVLLVHGGDTFSDDLLGNLTEGQAIIEMMNRMEYDFAALGNHDFDYGWERTEVLGGMANFPMRGANVLVAATGEPFLGDPVRVLERAGVKIGLLAIGYHNTDQTTDPKHIRGLRFVDGTEVATGYVERLREQADIVVIVSHQGTEVDRLTARRIEGIDLIVGGHSHDLFSEPEKVGGTWIVQSFSNGAVLGQVDLSVEDGRITGIDFTAHLLWKDEIAADADMQQLIGRQRETHMDRLSEVIGHAGDSIGRQYRSESPFDVLVGQILCDYTGADAAMLPGVGYGVTLKPGPIHREDLIRLLPHGAKLATVELTGDQIRRILEQSATNLKPRDPLDAVGGLIQTAHMRWTVDLSQPVGKRVSDVFLRGPQLEPETHYTVAIKGGMLEGLHRYKTFSEGRNVKKYDKMIADVVEAAFRVRGTVDAPAGGSIRVMP